MPLPGVPRLTSADTYSLTVIVPTEIVVAVAEQLATIIGGGAEESASPGVNSPYMTIPEAAEYLRCSRQRIDDLLSSRRLTRVKEGRRTLVQRTEIEAHLITEARSRRVAPGLPRCL